MLRLGLYGAGFREWDWVCVSGLGFCFGLRDLGLWTGVKEGWEVQLGMEGGWDTIPAGDWPEWRVGWGGQECRPGWNPAWRVEGWVRAWVPAGRGRGGRDRGPVEARGRLRLGRMPWVGRGMEWVRRVWEQGWGWVGLSDWGTIGTGRAVLDLALRGPVSGGSYPLWGRGRGGRGRGLFGSGGSLARAGGSGWWGLGGGRGRRRRRLLGGRNSLIRVGGRGGGGVWVGVGSGLVVGDGLGWFWRGAGVGGVEVWEGWGGEGGGGAGWAGGLTDWRMILPVFW